ncbi:MAG: PaaI family thioesterase [Prevotella sp.]
MRKIKNPYVGKAGYGCFGCCPENPVGLHMEFFEDGDDIVSFWRPEEHYQGWVGVLHGGILATLADEAAGWVVTRKLQTSGMTTRLNLQYKRPVHSSDAQLTVRARITDRKRQYVFIGVTIADANGDVCVEAEAVYYAFDAEKARQMGFSRCDVEDEQLFSM